MANAFKMTEKVAFVSTETVENENGFKIPTNTTVYECWANRLNMSNSEFTKSYTTFNKYLISFRVRYCKFTKSLEFNTKNYKVRYKNQILNIISALDYKTDLKSELILEELHSEMKKILANQNKILKYLSEDEEK